MNDSISMAKRNGYNRMIFIKILQVLFLVSVLQLMSDWLL